MTWFRLSGVVHMIFEWGSVTTMLYFFGSREAKIFTSVICVLPILRWLFYHQGEGLGSTKEKKTHLSTFVSVSMKIQQKILTTFIFIS